MRANCEFGLFAVISIFCVTIVIFYPSYLAYAESPEFAIDNSFKRELEIEDEESITTDLYTQSYELNWDFPISDRLDFGSTFKLTIEDEINSADIDIKTIVPSVNIGLSNPVFDYILTVDDIIEFTNEFNKERADDWSYAMELDFFPFLLPPFVLKMYRDTNYQEGLEDLVEDKIDISSSYTFGMNNEYTIDFAYKNTTKDDLIIGTFDENEDWKLNLLFNQNWTSGIRFDNIFEYFGESNKREDNINAAFTEDESRTLKNSAKFTLDGFQGITSTVELIAENEFVSDKLVLTENLSVAFFQDVLDLFQMKESFTVSLSDITVPGDDGSTLEEIYALELLGDPSKYIGYNLKYEIESNEESYEDASKNLDDVTRAFDLIFTSRPRSDLRIDLSYNRSADYSYGGIVGKTKSYKIEFNLDGEYLEVPGLTFTPTIDTMETWNLENNSYERQGSIEMILEYQNQYLQNFFVLISPVYEWTEEDFVSTSSFNVNYEFNINVKFGDGSILIENDGSFENTLSDGKEGGTLDWDKNFEVLLDYKFNRAFKGSYSYSYLDVTEGGDSDRTSITLSYVFKALNLSLIYTCDRSFRLDASKNKVYEGNISMQF